VIPVIDLRAVTEGSDEERRAVATDIDRACRQVGFFTVVGHGVADDTIEDLRREALAFFDLPLADRLAVAMPEPGYPYGYSPIDTEALNRSIGGDAAPDAKETFNIGPIDAPPRPIEQMDDPDERAVYAPNLWPRALPSLRPAAERYYRAMAKLSSHLMEGFALALDLPGDTFEPLIDQHASALRLAHYPTLDGAGSLDGRFRAGAHTDYGTLTVLWTDGEPGLQVLTESGWIDVEAVDGGLIVNLGDLLARWTNDRWRSTMHRVVQRGDGRRLSIPFFHNANWDAHIECIVGPKETARYPPITAGRHLMDKFRSTVM
jgi:isopenicillin N synthase-like dioxygenase